MGIATESPLLPWLVRHCGWILSRYAVGADGRTRYSRLKGRECIAGTSIFGEAIWHKLPKTADLTKPDDRWRTAICLERIGSKQALEGKSAEDEHRAHHGTLGQVKWWCDKSTSREALIERHGPTEDCGGCFRKSQHHSERCRARFDSCAQEKMGLPRSEPRRAASSTGSSSNPTRGAESKRQRTVEGLFVCSI